MSIDVISVSWYHHDMMISRWGMSRDIRESIDSTGRLRRHPVPSDPTDSRESDGQDRETLLLEFIALILNEDRQGDIRALRNSKGQNRKDPSLML